jgi:hypothetical protein
MSSSSCFAEGSGSMHSERYLWDADREIGRDVQCIHPLTVA